MKNQLVLGLVAGCALVVTRAAVAEGPIKNGLSSRSFRRNTLTTNQESLRVLRKHALSDQLFSVDGGHIAQQLADPHAMAMMHEIVKCALKTGALHFQGITWQGELGLCEPGPGAASDAPRWDDSGPNDACQQLVTACVTARVNALHEAVPISLHGQPAALFPPREPLSAETSFRESPDGQDPSEGKPIASFGGPLCGDDHECGWAAGPIGRCDRGTVQLALQDPSTCTTARLRVCAGIHGCYALNGLDKPPFDPTGPRAYGRWWAESSGACSGLTLSFDCPVGFGGYYGVMTHAVRAAAAGPGGVISAHPPALALVEVDPGMYPASDQQVFTFREGAFYGNLFDPDELSWNCSMTSEGMRRCSHVPAKPAGPASSGSPPDPTTVAGVAVPDELCDLRDLRDGRCAVGKTVPYRGVYACFSLAQQLDTQGTGDDDEGVAYLNDRICDEAGPSAPCFFHRPRRCHLADPALNAQRGAHCEWLAATGSYQRCPSADGTTTYLPITTYLVDPCDLLASADVCRSVRRSLATAARLPLGARASRCGCSLDARDGGLGSIALAALVAGVLRRRSRSADPGRARAGRPGPYG